MAVTAQIPRCADAAEYAGDPMAASAPPAQQWLLVEHCGPWGQHVLTDSGIDPAVSAVLARWTTEHSSRVTLIRRPGAAPRDRGRGGRWYRVDSRPGQECVRWGSYADESELVGVLADPYAGEASTEPVYLVCAHGRHDTCCAVRGRPTAAALAAAHPGRTWECSHIGGDRFAANLVVLPHGFYYGHVGAPDAVGVVAAYDDGRLDLPRLRGRSSLAAPAQAAQHYVRLATGEAGVDSLPVLASELIAPATWRVLLGGRPVLAVTVRARMVDAGRRLTCTATGPGRFRVFDLLELEQGPALATDDGTWQAPG